MLLDGVRDVARERRAIVVKVDPRARITAADVADAQSALGIVALLVGLEDAVAADVRHDARAARYRACLRAQFDRRMLSWRSIGNEGLVGS